MVAQTSTPRTYLGGIEMTDSEIAALDQLWQDLGPLFAGIVHRLGREEGLRVCRGIEAREMAVTWIIQPGRAVCVITKDGQTLHSFHLAAVTPVKLNFNEFPLGPMN